MKKIWVASTMLLCVVLATEVLAQTSNATVGGTVVDATGALLPGVTITATNIATGIVNTVVSNLGIDPPTAQNMTIDSTSFGRITTASGIRRFTIGARVNF